MAERLRASAQRKMSQTTLQQRKRALHLLALVPKPGAKSDLDESESSEDELHHHPRSIHSDSSSPPPSLPSSLENLHLLSDEDNEVNEITTTSLLPYQQSSPSNSNPSPSILSSYQATMRQLQLSQPLQSPLLHQDFTPLSSFASSSQVPSPCIRQIAPQTSNLMHDQVPPSPAYAPSPSAATRSRRARVIVTKRKTIQAKKLAPNWRCVKFTGCADIQNDVFKLSYKGKSPIGYFKLFFSDDVISLITHETNLYSTQLKGSSVNFKETDIRDFLMIIFLMGIVKMPAYTDYWSKDLRYEKIAGIMPLKKFQLMRRFLHFNDNLKDDGDRYFKIRPILQKIRENCLKIEEETRFSIDEMMVPHKGTRAGSRKQYIKNKPKKWGFKIFVRSGISGIVYDFLIYGGDDTFRFESFTDEENGMGLGSKVVLALAKTIRQPACKVICFDNFFTSLELIKHLRHEYGIFSVGTIRQNRLRGAENKLPTDKVLKKKGRGEHAQVVCNKNKLVVVKWFDNKPVTVASSYLDAYPIQVAERYKKEEKKRVPVKCPKIIKEYNSNMGGVDLSDMLVALYRTPFRGHRWYLPIFSQMIDICLNNAWLLYRRDLGDEKGMSLKKFRYEVCQGLLKFERPIATSSKKTSGLKIIQSPAAERPKDCIRYDQIAHFPILLPTRGRCKYCTVGQIKFYCQKCKIRLCLLPERNCFLEYHTKK